MYTHLNEKPDIFSNLTLLKVYMSFPMMKCVVKVKKHVSQISIIQSKLKSTLPGDRLDFLFSFYRSGIT